MQSATKFDVTGLQFATTSNFIRARKMTGNELRAALDQAGISQRDFAELMGVHRTVIGRQFQAKQVAHYWAYALAGLIASRMAKDLCMMVKI